MVTKKELVEATQRYEKKIRNLNSDLQVLTRKKDELLKKEEDYGHTITQLKKELQAKNEVHERLYDIVKCLTDALYATYNR